MDITEKIKSYEDACEALGLNTESLPIVENLPEKDRKSIIAYYKLTIITRALNEGWEPDWGNWDESKYYNWYYVLDSVFPEAVSYSAPSNVSATIGSRLCFKTSESANYARVKFRDLYFEYLFIENN